MTWTPKSHLDRVGCTGRRRVWGGLYGPLAEPDGCIIRRVAVWVLLIGLAIPWLFRPTSAAEAAAGGLQKIEEVEAWVPSRSQPRLSVTISGWVSFAPEGWPGFFLQGDRSGIYCELAGRGAMPSVGDLVEVEGVGASGFRNYVRATQYRVLGHRDVPPPERVSHADLWTGQYSADWVRAEGVVVDSRRSGTLTEFSVVSGGRTVLVRYPGAMDERMIPKRWSGVRVDGVSSEDWDGDGRIQSAVVWVSSAANVQVVTPPEEVVPGLPLVELAAVAPGTTEWSGHAVRVAGTVTWAGPGILAVERGGHGVFCHEGVAESRGGAEAGYEVEVLGWVQTEGPFNELRHARVLTVRGTDRPLPREKVSGARLRDVEHHGRRISVEAEFLHRSVESQGDMLICVANGETFEARLLFSGAIEHSEALRTGARIILTGVMRHGRVREAGWVAPRMMVTRASDLVVSHQAPWPVQRTIWVVSGLSAALGLGLMATASAYRRLRDTHGRLESTESELRRVNQDLEGRIAVRTSQLERTNEQLHAENTQRLAAMRTIEDRERRLVEAQAIARLGSFHWDAATDRVTWSAEVYVIFGLAPESFTPSLSGYLACVHPEDRARVDGAIRGAVNCGRDYAHEYRVLRPSGEVRWVHALGRIIAGPDGRLEGVEGTCQDITDRKLSELALRSSESRLMESERRFRSLVEGTDVVVWEYDPVLAVFTYVSPQAARFGYPLSAWMKPGFWEGTLHPEDRDAAVSYCSSQVSIGKAHRLQYRMLTADGAVVWVDDTVSVDLRADGTLVLRGVFVDVTELRRAEEQRRKLEGQLRQAHKLEAIGTLAGGIAHDFNNLLGVIMGTAELMKGDYGLTPDQRESVDDILGASRRGRDLVRQILTFSRREDPQRRLVSLPGVVDESMRLLRAGLPSNVELAVRVEGEIPRVMGDETQIQQVLMNLTANAAHAIGTSAGRIDVELALVRVGPGDVPLGAELAAGEYARLRVRDNGAGMTATTMERVFEPFFTTKGPGEGTGLGLAVVHGIAKAHGGTVTVHSEPGAGATFDVLLPIPAGIGTVRTEDAGGVSAGRGERILLVDDEAALLKTSASLLRSEGYLVEAVGGSAGAYEMLQADPLRFDLVITDFAMPAETGVDLGQRLLRLRPGLPIILCTGFGNSLTVERARALGFRDLLLKPVDREQLCGAVRRALDGGTTGT